jgi:glucoamylase
MAVDIAALALGARIARQDGHPAQAQVYQAVAQHWLDQIQSWTVTTDGSLSSPPYFVRISTAPNANNAQNTITIANGGSTYPQNAIVDQGFLSLVRLGLLSPADPVIQNSLKVIDQTIMVQTPNGPSFHRYNHDRYGNYADGAPYNGSGYGGLWPVLDGERGEYDLAAHLQGVQTPNSPIYYLQTMQKMAYGLGMIPEQVWPFSTRIPAFPSGTSPAAASIGLDPGVATGSAAPLNWAMAQYVRLAVDISQNRLVDQPRVLHNEFNLTTPASSALPLTASFSSGHAEPLPATGPYSVDSSNWVVNSTAQTISGHAAPNASIAVAVVAPYIEQFGFVLVDWS